MTSVLTSPVRIYRYAVIDSLRIVKRQGFRELLRQRGWKFVGGIAAYYLVRDSLLYIVVPLCLARGLF
jgi:hypothetical protein